MDFESVDYKECFEKAERLIDGSFDTGREILKNLSGLEADYIAKRLNAMLLGTVFNFHFYVDQIYSGWAVSVRMN